VTSSPGSISRIVRTVMANVFSSNRVRALFQDIVSYFRIDLTLRFDSHLGLQA
jgi:hypothetical protein